MIVGKITLVYGDRGVSDLGKYLELVETTSETPLFSSATVGNFASGMNGTPLAAIEPNTFASGEFTSVKNGSTLEALKSTTFESKDFPSALRVTNFTLVDIEFTTFTSGEFTLGVTWSAFKASLSFKVSSSATISSGKASETFDSTSCTFFPIMVASFWIAALSSPLRGRTFVPIS
jgi:hypothetical protein